ncbi:hypothetical protein KP77_12530 [Jeotgalibacillus alimentarius]|uniref:Uncharacterized protein n=1 Tax=Jeotgalibacillus alimentarius TaxID=135826 RepID=A0A0C2W582_9BACL|nr:hypothetical protein KP77_12530 [Jeotgalibacillus alimentarius]
MSRFLAPVQSSLLSFACGVSPVTLLLLESSPAARINSCAKTISKFNKA